jgi:Family of unknown function (DUF6188)
MIMELTEDGDGWTLSFRDGRVQLIQIDFRLSLLVSEGTDEAWLHIETQARIRRGETDMLLVPEQTTSLAPILASFNVPVANIRIGKKGHLRLEFLGGSLLDVDPDEAYEAWQIECSIAKRGLMFVCMPGGEVVSFRDPNVRGIRRRARTFGGN